MNRRTGTLTLPGSLLTPLLGSLLVIGAAGLHAQTPTGCWAGTLGTGAGQIRGAFEFTRDQDAWAGSIHRIGQTVDSEVFLSVRVDGPEIEATFPSSLADATATFRGRMEGAEIQGTSEIQGQSVPVSLTRVDPSVVDPALPLLGYWSGGITQGTAVLLRLGLEFAPAPCGLVAATMDSPDQGAEDIPVTMLRAAGDSLAFEIASIAGSFRGRVTAGGDSIAGTWSQGPQSVDLHLGRNPGPLSFTRPQDPEFPLPYVAFEVTFESHADGIELAGTLTLPNGNGPFPAVMLLSGSGPQDRDEMIAGHRPFLVLSDHLTRNGVAVLRVDDRGVGGSSGNVMDATIDDNVLDALAGLELLADRPEIDPARIGLLGHSEGGWLAPAVAAESEDVGFVVLLAGPAVTGREVVSEQTRLILEASGAERIEARLALNAIFLDLAATPDIQRSGEDLLAEVARRIENAPPGVRDDLRELWATEVVANDAGRQLVELQLAPLRTPWFQGIAGFDPTPFLAGLSIPVLAIFGERDLQVSPAQSVPVLEVLWTDHPDATIRVFPELNHLFQHADTGLPTEYAQIEETLAPEVLDLVSDWITDRFGGP